MAVSDGQTQEIKEVLENIDADDIIYRNLHAPQFETLKGRENAEKSWQNKTDWPITIQNSQPVIILHDEEKVYIFFETYSEGLIIHRPVAKTNGREVFCRTYSIMPAGPGAKYSIPSTAQYQPSIMEKSLREFIGDWVEYVDGKRNIRIEPSIDFVNMDWRFDRATYKHKTKSDNLLEKMKTKLEAEFSVIIAITYNRPAEHHFTIRSIQWSK